MYTTQDSAAQGISLLDYPAPAGRAIRGAFDEALETNPIPLWMMSAQINDARSIGPRLSKADAEQQATFAGVKVKVPDEGLTQGALSLLIERRRDDAARQVLYARREGAGAAIGSFAASLAGTLLDPLNVAAGFIPIMGGTRYSMLLEKASAAGERAVIRTGVGATEGLVGATAVEGPIIALRRDLQDDYSLYDSLANITFGTFASAGIRVAGGAVKDIWVASRRLRQIQDEQLRDMMPGLERSVQQELDHSFERGAGIPEDLRAQMEQTRRTAAAGAEAEARVGAQRMRFSEAEIEGFIRAEERMRAEAAVPDDRRLLDAAGIAERKFAQMDLAEVRERLERGEGLIIVPGNPREVLQAIGPETHANALRAAVAQAIEGQKIDVDAVVRQDPVFGPERQGLEVVLSRARSQLEPENLVAADKQASQAAAKVIEAGPPKAPKAPAAAPGEPQEGATGGAKGPAAQATGEAPGAPEAQEAKAVDAALQKAGPGPFRALAIEHLQAKARAKGEPLRAKEIAGELEVLAKEVVEGKHDAAIERAKMLQRGADEWTAIADELQAVDLPATRQNILDTDAVARASSIDEAAVERAAVLHEADDAAFMAAVREILSDADKNAETARSRPAPARQAPSAPAAPEARTGPRGLEDPQIRATIRDIADHETGWAQVGGQLDRGRLIKEMGRDAIDEFGEATKLGVPAFTQWIPNAEWWMSRPDKKMNARAYERAVAKALKGEPLKKIEQRAIDFLVDMANERLGLHEELGTRVLAKDALAEQLLKGPDGKPIQVYHGTQEAFDQFSTDKMQDWKGWGKAQGFWFTDNPKQASSFATMRGAGEGANIRPSYLIANNPLTIDVGKEFKEGRRTTGHVFEDIVRRAKEAGHDAVVFENNYLDIGGEGTHYLVFKPEQIVNAFEERQAKATSSPEIQEAEALLAETRQNADQAAAAAGTEAPAPSTERARADEYEKAYKAIGDCAPKEGS